jgi:hypothetical protein
VSMLGAKTDGSGDSLLGAAASPGARPQSARPLWVRRELRAVSVHCAAVLEAEAQHSLSVLLYIPE